MKPLTTSLVAAAAMIGIAVSAGSDARAAGDYPFQGGSDAQALAAMPVSLNATVEVDDVYIRLGDLFDGAGQYADKPVAYAPDPGDRKTLDANWLFKVARGYGLDWRPVSRYETASVTRLSQIIEPSEVESAVRAALDRQAKLPDNAEIELNNGNLRLHVATDARREVAVRDVDYDTRTQRFAATVEVPAGAPDAETIRVTGQAFAIEEIPVLTRNVGRGDVIGEKDIAWMTVRARQIRRDTVMDPTEMVGYEPKRFLRADVPVRRADLRRPVMIEKNGITTMVFKSTALTLTTKGKALENGAMGDTIRVQNLNSRTTVLGTVTGHNTVEVEPLNAPLAN